MSEFSFKYCPVCGKELESGKLMIPDGYSVTEYIWWYSEKKVLVKRLNECTGLFRILPAEYYKKNSKKLNIPAGYCKRCDRIFAEFDIRENYNPIGEETIPTYDMDYYEESNDNLYEDKIVSYDSDSYDEIYNNIGGYKIITDSIKFKKSED